ncbi:hypothetical protein BT67DRAFT_438320 [Trichocladium antarcticum]|uniref:Tse2 ADP-ribosyltransferase toxin domain-containing protein n=1 Tax=Trichocladium antarcticum TaxID=1450529 RepID=A0AAN6ZIT7_9PEZI|nr:hypothetical protein BT67DRAFT_438320 [Trichocladium antarcticum]
MFAPVSRSLLGQRLPRRAPRAARVPRLQRAISQMPLQSRAVLATFPATMHYYSPHRLSSLFDCSEKASRPDDLRDEAVSVADDGLVYPRVGTPSPHDPTLTVSNGAVFMPNTFWMQELARLYYDQYYADLVDEGKQVEAPYIYTVAKGTPVPSRLILVHELKERFSLQPSGQGMSLNDLNRSLDEFYSEHARKKAAYKWLSEHPLHECMDGADEQIWMC